MARGSLLGRTEENVMRVLSASYTHVGRRNNNEDAHCRLPALGLYAVADGMGGYEGGEVASRLAIDSVIAFVRDNAGDDDVTWPYKMERGLGPTENLVQVAARLANHEVAERRVGRLQQMGSTLAMLLVKDEHVILGHVGDSRIYRLRCGLLEQLTVDHSVYEEMRRASGGVMPPKSETGFGHMITRALGMSEETRADVRSEKMYTGDTFLLCSDGLTEVLSEPELAAGMGGQDLETACRSLCEKAYDAGGRDNITAILARVI
jgi:serine/threonine protein phosphatase PrpC